MAARERAIELLAQLRELGVRIALDDFGTGYSSLSYLKSFPIDMLKIDRSFVAEMLTDHTTASIMEAIISMTRILGLSVIAEGVEDQAQFAFLQRMGCDAVQGFYFSGAVPPPISSCDCCKSSTASRGYCNRRRVAACGSELAPGVRTLEPPARRSICVSSRVILPLRVHCARRRLPTSRTAASTASSTQRSVQPSGARCACQPSAAELPLGRLVRGVAHALSTASARPRSLARSRSHIFTAASRPVGVRGSAAPLGTRRATRPSRRREKKSI